MGALPEAEQRACLLHELAHLARRDDLTKLMAELIRAPFWFHPAVAWLVARLDREAELACDEAAVGRGVAPRELAQLLIDFARKPRRLDPRGLSLDHHALSFFDRGTVSTRISRLLEDDMARTTIPPSKTRLLGLVASLAALALAIGGARVRAIEPDAPKQQPAPSEAATPAPDSCPGPGPDAVPPPTRSLSVVVKDTYGRPVEGATVVATDYLNGAARDVVQTDTKGQARFDRAPGQGIILKATREGYGFASHYDMEMAKKTVHDPPNLAPAPIPVGIGRGRAGPPDRRGRGWRRVGR